MTTFLLGYDPALENGPWAMAVVDARAARKLGVGLGDEVLIFGAPFRVRGLSAGTYTITNSVALYAYEDARVWRAQGDRGEPA